MPAKANPARKVGGGSKTKWKPKPGAPRATKKPRPVDERVKRHFVSLTAQIDGAHFKNAIKTCNKLLLLKPNDADVLQTKLFLLLQTEQYAPAFELASATTGIDLDYQRAYSMYRLNQEAEAASLIGNIKQRDLGEDVLRGVDILDAQLYYRRGDYEHAVQSFTQLLDSCAPGSEEQQDLLTNLTAAQTHLDFLTTGFQSALSKLPAATLQSLETAQPPAHPTASTSHVVPVAATTAAAATPAPKAPKPPRPSRVPKGVVPGVTPPPDPERWIKKSERTNLPVSRHKKGKKVVGAAGTTQGSTNIPESGHPTSSGGGGGGGKKKRR